MDGDVLVQCAYRPQYANLDGPGTNEDMLLIDTLVSQTDDPESSFYHTIAVKNLAFDNNKKQQ